MASARCSCNLASCLNCRSPGPFTPGVIPVGPVPPPVSCCIRTLCQKLRVIVICPPAWERIPGVSKAPCTRTRVNEPPAKCQFPLTPGLAAGVKLQGTPGALPNFDPWPSDVTAAYGRWAKYAKTFMFDFGNRAPALREADAKMVAYGSDRSCGSCLQASLEFVYRWCGPATCGDVELPQFEIVNCTYKNVRFVVLDDTSFLSSDWCYDSTVVLMVQQWCALDMPDTTAPAPGQLAPSQPCRGCALDCVTASRIAK